MNAPTPILRLGTVKTVERFQEYLQSLGVSLPVDTNLETGAQSPLLSPIDRGGIKIGNRIAVNPMEGWDGTPDGNPSENTVRRWQRFGQSGAKLIWGGEAAAVSHEGRANPNQVVVASHTRDGISRMRKVLLDEHRRTMGSDDGLVVGLQLTHSGRYCRPNPDGKPAPRILYRHPILDRRLKLADDYPVLTDGEIEAIIEDFHRAAKTAAELGFDFVDVKHCHGYLGHEFLSARTRDGKYGGSFENRTRFLREVVAGIRSNAPTLKIGVRLSAFDVVPYRPDPARSSPGKTGPGVPDSLDGLIPYRWGFGVDRQNPTQYDLTEPIQFLSLLQNLKISLVNLTAGSPYYNPHIQRPALYPPSDGYQPPEDPLIGVARATARNARSRKQKCPELIITGTAYSYLQDFLPQRRASGRPRRLGRSGRPGPHGALVPRRLTRRRARRNTPAQAHLPHLQRLHNGAAQRIAVGLLPARPALQTFSDDGAARRRESQEMKIESLLAQKKPRRKITGIAAALLPFDKDGRVAVESFQKHLVATQRAGLQNAVNMDTGYVNYLSDAEKRDVLRWTREALGDGTSFVAGAYIERDEGDDVVALYRKQMDEIVKAGGTPILFQTRRLHGKSATEKAATYAATCKGYREVLGFELGQMFAPNGEIFDADMVKRLLDIPEIKGMKHSSLDRLVEIRRLELRDTHRPDFRIYTGNDLGIDMIEYGSDYLLGLATFAPEKFAERDRLWENGDAAYYALSDALQHLGNVAFRHPVPAYKHSAAVFLHATGRIPSDRTHPQSAARPEWESQIISDCVRRLGL